MEAEGYRVTDDRPKIQFNYKMVPSQKCALDPVEHHLPPWTFAHPVACGSEQEGRKGGRKEGGKISLLW